jgi:hypothetical protein
VRRNSQHRSGSSSNEQAAAHARTEQRPKDIHRTTVMASNQVYFFWPNVVGTYGRAGCSASRAGADFADASRRVVGAVGSAPHALALASLCLPLPGYARIVFMILAFYVCFTRPSLAALCYVISQGLDAVDGQVARAFSQVTNTRHAHTNEQGTTTHACCTEGRRVGTHAFVRSSDLALFRAHSVPSSARCWTC